MNSQPDNEENKEFYTFYPTLGENDNSAKQNQQDSQVSTASLKSQQQIVENEAEPQSFKPVTDQPVSVSMSMDVQAASEDDGLLNNRQFSSQFCRCDGDCFKAFCCPCISIYSTEKELSNDKKGIG
jgi:hypothetical protein